MLAHKEILQHFARALAACLFLASFHAQASEQQNPGHASVPGHRFTLLYRPNQAAPDPNASPVLALISNMTQSAPASTLTLTGYTAPGESSLLVQQRLDQMRDTLVSHYGLSQTQIKVELGTAANSSCQSSACVVILLQSPDDLAAGLATEVLLQRAEAGDGAAQYQLAMRYYGSRRGVPHDVRQGAHWLHRALEQGDAGAVNAVVTLIDRKSPAPFAWTDIASLLEKAAGQGNGVAQLGLGQLYEFDSLPGITQDKLKAAENYQAAATKGLPYAAYRLARMYAYTNHDYRTVASWLQRGAQNGSWRGAEVLSLMYDSGTGVEQDKALAQAWRAKVLVLTHGKPLPAAEIAKICQEFNLPIPADVRATLAKVRPAPQAVEDELTLGSGANSASWDIQGALPSIGVCNLAYSGSGRSVCDAPK